MPTTRQRRIADRNDRSRPPAESRQLARSLAVALTFAAALAFVGVHSHGAPRIGDGLAEVPHRWAAELPRPRAADSLAALRAAGGRVLLFVTDKAADRLDVLDAADGTWLRCMDNAEAGAGGAAGGFRSPNGVARAELPGRLHALAAATPAGGGSSNDGPGDPLPPESGPGVESPPDGDRGNESPPARKRGAESPAADSARGALPSEALFVVERGNRRVHALSPEGRTLGTFGEGVLQSPLGVAVSRQGGSILLYVTDTAGLAEARVHVFLVESGGAGVSGRRLRSFGEEGEGDLDDPESIAVDDAFDRVLVCDERRRRPEVKVYRRDGRFIGTLGAGLIEGEPEGIALIADPAGQAAGDGWIIVTDQRRDLTVWHAFERRGLRHVTSFTGRPRIANTDGICIYPSPLGSFEQGALFAIHDDREVRAYDLRDVLALLRRP